MEIFGLIGDDMNTKDENKIVQFVSRYKDSIILKSSLLLIGSWIFAFLLGIVIHELGHALSYKVAGIPGIKMFFHPFDYSYTEIGFSSAEFFNRIFYELSGPLHNIFWATLIPLILWRFRSQKTLPFLMMAPAAYIPEGVAIMDGVGRTWGDWGQAVYLGLPFSGAIAIGIVFLAIGLFSALLLIPIAYDVPKTNVWKRLIINLMAFPIWYLLRVIYSLSGSTTLPEYLIGGSLIALGASSGSVLLFTGIQKPIYPYFNEKISPFETKEIKWSSIGIAVGLAIIMILIFALTPYVPI